MNEYNELEDLKAKVLALELKLEALINSFDNLSDSYWCDKLDYD